eukprot:TRINITY_DN11229_c0_g2_i2.p1 TRINITY_DN11229_c0_g2~~TRINITY_DN11229_c0_g2_i2.p1  ORF type:complete len:753 (+),score=71.00 TRINITY_DN11229_c0_g2_i2:161-2260(+)
MGAVAMVFGILSWWVNYDFSQGKSFVIKLYASIVTLILGIIGIAIYLSSERSVYEMDALGIIYHLSVFATVITVIVLGYYGGKITWGSPRKKPKTSAQKAETDSSSEAKKDINITSKASKLPDVPDLKDEFHIDEYIKKSGSFSINKNFKDINIQIAGPAGAGLNAISALINATLKKEKLYHFITSEYMSRVRGGSNTTFIRVAEEPISSAKWSADLLLLLDKDSFARVEERCKDALIVGDSSFFDSKDSVYPLEVNKKVESLGKIYANSYLFGALIKILNLPYESAKSAVEEIFKDKSVDKNLEAFESGYSDSESKKDISDFSKNLKDNEGFLSGGEASGLGFLSGGVNFVSSYPMSPSTSVLGFMAKHSDEFKVVVEQAEDEIAGFNLMLGSWNAGGRGLTTTSGGGFALMNEGMSLSGMSETPALVYLAQRPGPATGLPTRTEQGDLNLALFAGHGVFARALIAPGDSDEAIKLAHLSTHLADFFQIPVVYLSDQFFADSIRVSSKIEFEKLELHNYISKSTEEYKRYEIGKSTHGISPRAVPGFGEGLVVCSSDEHEEDGQITEDYRVREQMLKKRAKKLEHLKKHALPPEIDKRGDIAVIGWGSTKGVLQEVCSKLELTHIHFSWIYPLNHKHLEKLKGFKKLIVAEVNEEGQFAELLKKEGVDVDRKILNSNGFSFFADSLEIELKECLKEIK